MTAEKDNADPLAATHWARRPGRRRARQRSVVFSVHR